ncbi:MAG: CRISPR-associated endonuclease Cas2 [Bdellovibrionota bacterium]|jgi:CRISPR-associated protein Cas2
MSLEGERFMWILLFFDLPTVSKVEKRQAQQFRKFLIKDGYIMLQWSVYARICNGRDGLEKHLRRVQRELPDVGNVRTLEVTDRQFGKIKMLLGKKRIEEKKNGPSQLSLF